VVKLTASAHCLACDWTAEGDPDAADRAAEKHTNATGHATASVTEAIR